MFRFFHTADLHLDAPLRSLALRDPDLAEAVGAASRVALTRIVDLCLEERVDALLIAGDLFDGEVRSMKTAAFLGAEMARLAAGGVRVFVIRGNHDAESVLTRALDLPENVHVFTGHGGTEVLEAAGVAIHGVSFAKPHAPESLLPRYPAPVPGMLNIGLMHTSLMGAPGHDPYAPVSAAELAAHGYDYWALGHVHKRQVHSDSAPAIVMPGMPQGRDIGEDGVKSATLVTLDAERAALEARPTAALVFARAEVSLAGEDDWRAAQARVAAALRAAAEPVPGALALRLTLTGATPLAFRLRRDADLLTATLAEAAQAQGGVWLEKLVLEVTPPEQAGNGQGGVKGGAADDPRHALVGLMAVQADDPGVRARAGAEVEALVADLPPEVRDAFGATPEALADATARLLREGAEEITARLMAGAAEPTETDT